ncbi:sensor histidine kinase [Microbispora sp. NPDC049125]|uniref:sensor histidine kinase n=1 Tax=Microbispora sp. NPDC049125 TaxID=3154929 RepID=UPI003465B246
MAAFVFGGWDGDCERRPSGWATAGGGLILAVLLLLAPASTAWTVTPSWPVWAAVVTAAVSFCAALLTAQRPAAVRRHIPAALIGLLAVVTVAATLAYGPANWHTLYTLLAVGVAAVLPLRLAPSLVAATALVGGGTAVAQDGQWNEAIWGTAAIALLAGLTTYGFRRMAETIAELARTREQLASAAVATERLRFARDLHDLLGHTLSMVVLKAEAVRRLAPLDTAAAARHAGDIEVIGRQALTEVREAVTGYRDAGLAFELDSARAALAAAGIDCVVEESGPALPSEADTLLGWVVREGVTNVVRHSRARQCRITLRRDTDPVLARISDDGRGGDPGASPGSSGLRGLRERLAAGGGNVHAASAGGGFVLTAELPRPGGDDGP